MWLPEEKRWPVVLFTVVRAIELQVKMMVRRKVLPDLEDGDTLLMALASASMVHSYMYTPKCLDPSYVGFLNRHSQTHRIVKAALVRRFESLILVLT